MTGPSYLPEIVSIRSLSDIKAEFLAHGEIKSETPDAEPADVRARGLVQRRHVSPAQIVLIGKESNRLDEVAAGLHGDLRALLADYEARKNRPSRELLISVPAAVIAKSWGVTVRTVRVWRKNKG